MSQQTLLAVLLPYYERFVGALPNVRALAAASEAELRQLWAGLGYYTRAANLQRGARYIVESYGEGWPDSYEEWLKVPGCGPYTAAAVSSICFNARVAAVDGNVVRVFARLKGLGSEIHTGAGRDLIRRELTDTIHGVCPGAFNQAMMELGALICRPRRPSCDQCPLQTQCAAFAQQRTHEIPPPKPRRAAMSVNIVALVPRLRGTGHVAVCQRSQGLLSRTNGFPILHETQLADCPSSFEIEQKPFAFSHSITHHRLKVKVAEVILRDESELVIMLRWLAPSASRPSATECVLGAWGGVSSARWFRMEEVLHAVSSSLDRKAWCQITDATKYPTVLD